MAIPAARSAAPTWPRLPRRTARLRLTFLYGGLFLACGAILLAVSYVLAEQAIAPPGGHVNEGGFSRIQIGIPAGLITVHRGSHTLTPGQVHLLMRTLGKAITRSDLRQVLIDAPIALAIVTVVALALGWLAAGRVLRPLATITAAARRISASNLHQRLALRGPDDELKALGDTLDTLFARLEAAFDAQRHFAANASHELRTPLTRERAMLQVALDDPGTTAETWRGVAWEVLASNTEQESLIEALLTLASGEGGLGQRELVDLAAITGEILRARRSGFGRQGLRVQAGLRPAALDGDPLLAERLVANLVDNAVRHNIAGGQVEISTATRDGRAVLTVANTGPAIPAEAVGRLFQPFLRLDGRRMHHDNGHGLGLSIVRAIAAAHGASITARARPGGGLAIDVTFSPAASADGNPSQPSGALCGLVSARLRDYAVASVRDARWRHGCAGQVAVAWMLLRRR
jgi:signal transduction histidine kinase